MFDFGYFCSKTRAKHFLSYFLYFLTVVHQLFELIGKIFKLNFDLSGPKLLMNGLARLHYDIVFSPDFMKIESGSVYEYNVDECEIGQGYFGKEVCQERVQILLSFFVIVIFTLTTFNSSTKSIASGKNTISDRFSQFCSD